MRGHDPLPWHYYPGGNFSKVASPGYDELVEETGYLGGAVCDMDDWNLQLHQHESRSKRAIANGRFIVRACNAHYELLASVRRLLQLVEDLTPGVQHIALPDYAELNTAPRDALLALAKATE